MFIRRHARLLAGERGECRREAALQALYTSVSLIKAARKIAVLSFQSQQPTRSGSGVLPGWAQRAVVSLVLPRL
ncbi:hypothetical protein ACH40F_47920 [Streptomyces sp. NPDC020794]|uniref:hypothetical protein n=1 Tax=unclassified Streptomyces TaxID=2593676 RepID=UPI0036E02B03